MTKAKLQKIRKFFSQFPTKKFSKNQIILKPGDKFENVYFIKSGFVRTYTVTPKGESTLNLFRPLFCFSVIHSISKNKNNFFFQSLTPVEIYSVSFTDFKKYIDTDKELSRIIMDFFLSSLMSYFTNQSHITNGTAQNKIASVLLQLAQDYGVVKNTKLIVKFPATHRIIANLVGLTRETTSVQMSKLQKIGVISTKRTQFVVNDLEKLKKIAQSN